MVNVLLCCGLLPLATGGLPGAGATTREQENAAQELAFQIFGCWFLGGLLLFAVLGLGRALCVHLATLLLAPAAVLVLSAVVLV
ncbi:hypothetical protein GCM10020295_46960 [Streptomyces cinereospinus]